MPFILQVLRTIFGVVKEKDFERKLHTVNELREFTSDIDANRNLCVTVCHSFGFEVQGISRH